MPFTPIHAAAALPFLRTPLVPSALVAGAVAPDLPYYVSLQWIGGYDNLTLTHEPLSLLWLNPLIALALLVLFHGLLKRPLVALLPDRAAARLTGAVDAFRWRTPRDAALVLASVVVGAATHLAWDAAGGVLGIPGFDLLSDVAGAVVLVWWLRRWWDDAPLAALPAERTLTSRERSLALAAVVVPAVAHALLQTARLAGEVSAGLSLYGGWSVLGMLNHAARAMVTEGGAALGVLLVGYAVVYRVVRPTVRPGALSAARGDHQVR